MAGLVDAYGRPISVAKLKQELAGPSMMGVRNAANFPSMQAALTPERLANILRAVDGGNAEPYLTLAEEMEEKDTHYASVLGTRKGTIASLQVVVESHSDNAKDVEIADAVRSMLTGDGASDLLSDLADAIGKGYSVCEIMWETSAKQWWPQTFPHRDPRYFRFDMQTRTRLELVDDNGAQVPMAPGKFIVHYPKIKTGLPIRGGLARLCAISYMIKSYNIKDWLAFVEVFGLPLRIGKYDIEASPEDRATLLRAISMIGTDAGCIIPRNMDVEFQAPANQTAGATLFKNFADWINGEMSKAVLGQTMTTENGSSLAQAEVHDRVRKDILDKDSKQLAATLRRDVVQPFVDLNYGKPAERYGYPKITLLVEEAEDLEKFAKAVTPFIDRGLRVSESQVRDKFGLDEPEEGDVVLGPVSRGSGQSDPEDDPQTDEDGNKTAEGRGTQKKGKAPANEDVEAARAKVLARLYRKVQAGQTLSPDERTLILAYEARPLDTTDREVQSALKDWHQMMDPIAGPIADAVAQCESPDDVEDALRALVGTLGIEKFTEEMAQWSFIARARGDATDLP